VAGVAALAAVLAAGCWDPIGDTHGGGSFDSCGAGLISYPTREPSWGETTAGTLIGGQVYHSTCDEPERRIEVTVSNEATGFSQTQTASIECVQIFPTTGATQRNYYYDEYVPLAPGQNRIEVRSGSSCGALQVSCSPCVDPPPLPDAGPVPDGGPDAGPSCELEVTRPGPTESETILRYYEASGLVSTTAQQVQWLNLTSGQGGQMTYTIGETSWYGVVELVESAVNEVEVTALCPDGLSDSATFSLTHVPP